ncbi:Transposase [Oopsacas minuta]|uniref:Transposase n=1 Tax=Oopsacas minuta TaxID=111878 RepID=A0AAV7KE84_9METZ|nr:Transposase [Oopsacas minuta]
MAQESYRIKIETLFNGGLKIRSDAGFSIKNKRGGGRPGKIFKSIKYSATQKIKSDPEINLRKLANKLTEKKKKKSLDAKLFVNILKWHLIDQAEVFHRNRWFLVQDNDPKHKSKLVKGWMSENMPNSVFEWPSQSPELNPIENEFAVLKGHVSNNILRT